MAYRQITAFNQSKAGSKAGWCLQNVRSGFGISGKYLTAIEAWYHTVQHKDRAIPTGVAVPLFYTYKSDGHVNVQLPDGRVWSDGNLYANLAAYESSHPAVSYLGWGETLNDVRVIEYVKDPATPVQGGTMPTLTTKTDLDFLYTSCLGRPRGAGEGEDVYLGKDYKFVAEDLYNSKEAKARRAAEASTIASLQTLVDAKNKELAQVDDDITDLKKTVETQTTRISELNKIVTNQQNQALSLQAQLSAHGDYSHITIKQAVQVLVQAFKDWIK